MPSHWTYTSFEAADHLEQGDILAPTHELREIFSEVHKHFVDDKYVGFLVATQSCDLVLRKGNAPKASYVNLCVIRPLESVIHKFVAQACTPVKPGLYRESDKVKAKELLNRIFNQNEQAQGLFFLHADADAGIAQPSVAMLRISVALRSEHYQALLNARIGRINEEFRAKLGWLLGNLYARPATRDWLEREGGKDALSQLEKKYVTEQIPEKGPNWIADAVVAEALKQNLDMALLTSEQLTALAPKSKYEQSIELIQQEVMRLQEQAVDDLTEKLGNRLKNNGRFKALFK